MKIILCIQIENVHVYMYMCKLQCSATLKHLQYTCKYEYTVY